MKTETLKTIKKMSREMRLPPTKVKPSKRVYKRKKKVKIYEN